MGYAQKRSLAVNYYKRLFVPIDVAIDVLTQKDVKPFF